MGFTKFVEIGRVAMVNKGKKEGRLVVILDVVNLNRVLVEEVDGDHHREVLCIKSLTLTENKINILRGLRSSLLKKAITKEKV